MKLLMHTCCAPCSIMCIETLRQEGLEPVLYFYNPNIHPCKEFRLRKTTLIEYAAKIGARLITDHEYGLRAFIKAVFPDFDKRCRECYKMRFEKTAQFAKEK